MSTLNTSHLPASMGAALKLQDMLTGNPEALEVMAASGIGAYLAASETKLILLMAGRKPADSLPGSIEFGLMLYLLHRYAPTLARLLGLPPSTITESLLAQWQPIVTGAGAVYADGSLVRIGPYAVLDPNWLGSAIIYLLTFLTRNYAPFRTTPAIVTAPPGTPTTIAIVGDWGTGNWIDGAITCPALAVRDQIVARKPDAVIHLGDVYYSGLSSEEQDKLIDVWPAGAKWNFTLNSNHEIYDGSNGYFGTALTAPLFAAQKGTSYFAIDGDTWIIIGLDSAYYATSVFNMTGALTDSAQLGFIKGLDLNGARKGKKVIVMTHHHGITIDGSARETLWDNVAGALGRAPDYWYWGHIHNGISYSSSSAAGATRARCVGHGAIPFGSAYELLQPSCATPIPSIAWFANTPLSNPDPEQLNRVRNGFLLLTLGQNGITEEWIDQTGAVAWSE